MIERPLVRFRETDVWTRLRERKEIARNFSPDRKTTARMGGVAKLYTTGFEGVVRKLNVARARFANGLDMESSRVNWFILLRLRTIRSKNTGKCFTLTGKERWSRDGVNKGKVKLGQRKKGRNAERDVGSFEEAI